MHKGEHHDSRAVKQVEAGHTVASIERSSHRSDCLVPWALVDLIKAHVRPLDRSARDHKRRTPNPSWGIERSTPLSLTVSVIDSLSMLLEVIVVKCDGMGRPRCMTLTND